MWALGGWEQLAEAEAAASGLAEEVRWLARGWVGLGWGGAGGGVRPGGGGNGLWVERARGSEEA